MNSALTLRQLTRADLAFADSVRALVGWNQTRADWDRFLAAEPQGCFLAEWHGAPAGTATTTVYGPELAWIGMVLVHPEFRRRGIGRALLERCIEHLQQRKVRCLKLDATPLGRPVYLGLGFQDEWTLRRWARPAGSAPVAQLDSRSAPWLEADLRRVEPLDATAFGVSRKRLLPALARQSLAALVRGSEPAGPAGYGFLRPGSQALYLGPVVAATPEAGLGLAAELLARSGDHQVYWDIPDDNTVAVAWAEQHGFTEQRPLTRMFLGDNTTPGDPRLQFALAGPEVG